MSEQAIDRGTTNRAPMRVSQRPGSIPCTLRDLEDPEIIQRLREALNVGAFAREIAQIHSEGVLPCCISISK